MIQKKEMVLGIDPGYGRLGIAVVEKTNIGKEVLVYSECLETNNKLPHSERLLMLGERIQEVINDYRPTKLATETLLWSKNKKTALQVAEARGVIIFKAKENKLKIYEYNPNQIKLAVTGYGKSDKNQIIKMVQKLINVDNKNKKILDDEYDAIAIAITCLATNLSTTTPS